jgi:hypothetical protein
MQLGDIGEKIKNKSETENWFMTDRDMKRKIA